MTLLFVLVFCRRLVAIFCTRFYFGLGRSLRGFSQILLRPSRVFNGLFFTSHSLLVLWSVAVLVVFYVVPCRLFALVFSARRLWSSFIAPWFYVVWGCVVGHNPCPDPDCPFWSRRVEEMEASVTGSMMLYRSDKLEEGNSQQFFCPSVLSPSVF